MSHCVRRAGQDGALGERDVWIQVLGPVCAWRGDDRVGLGAVRQRAVLGLLALAGGQPVSRAELIEALWSDRPPSSAVNVIQTHIKHLRHRLEPDRRARTTSTILPIVGDGYALPVPAGDVDVLRFRQLVTAAEEARRDGEQRRAAALLGEGLGLWRGSPLCDVPFLATHPKVVRLAGERHAALVRYGELMISIGAAADTLAALVEAAAADPLDEAIHALLIRAYQATGRRAKALAIYDETRRRLTEELGLDPGTELTAALAALLDGRGAAVATHTAAVRPVPAQLPADVPDFTGRARELSELDSVLAGDSASTAMVIFAISGTAGVGKTALAVHWAHRVRDRFPDGQLYVNLRGYDSDRPVPAGDALTRFLTALGVPNQDVPIDVDDRGARYRTEVAGRRILIVLDNAATVEQVRPLLPGAPSCVVVVTSRDSLAGLVALHGARRLDLALLPLTDATSLLHRLIGGKVEAEPAAVATLARQCARLPLALRVAAELAVIRGATPLSEFVEALADRQGRLDLLDPGPDQPTAIRAVFSWSYQHLPPAAARVFRLLALHPGADLDSYAVAALVQTSLGHTRRLLDLLCRAHLVERTGAGRHGMHDLLHGYAAGRAETEDAADDRRAALTRLFDYYLATAAAAVDLLEPGAQHHRPRITVPDTPMPPLPDATAGRAWLDAERPTLVAISGYATDHGWPWHTTRLAATLYRYLDGGYYTDALAIYSQAADAAGQLGDRSGQAHALTNLGSVYRLRGRYDTALAIYRRALARHHNADDRRGEARVLTNLGIVYERLGRHDPAIQHHQRAAALYRQVGDGCGEARALTNLGIVDERLGRYSSASDHHRQALARYRQAGDQICEAVSLSRLCLIDARLGRPGLAGGYHRQALALFRDAGHRRGEAHILANLAEVNVLLGHYWPAAGHYRQALALFREIGYRHGEAAALNGLGEALHGAGRLADALAHHAKALAIATETRDRDEQARSHAGLATNHQHGGSAGLARHHWQRALTGYTALGAPEADTARAALAALAISRTG
jgi:DNA-binding SARP family transcriptional activator/Tfp pilus assembly protein PilF